MAEPTDAQKLVIHIAKEAWKRGAKNAWITRDDMLNDKTIPQGIGMKLLWGALTLPDGILEWSSDQQSFRLSQTALEAMQ